MLHLTNGAETEQLLAMSSVFKQSFSSLAVFFSFCRRKKLLADIVNYTFFFLLIALFFNATFIDFLSRFLYFSFFSSRLQVSDLNNDSGCKKVLARSIDWR